MTPLWRIGGFLWARQRWVLIALLVVLHLTLLAGTDTVVSLMCWFVDVGLFMLWQPFVRAERRLDSSTLLLIALVLAAGAWSYGSWLLIFWVAVLASLLGGRVMMLSHLPTRVFYLLAFAYLLCALLVWLVPRVVPDASLLGPSLAEPFAWGAPVLFLIMLLLPRPPDIRLPSSGIVDFFYSIFIFLLISVLVLGSLAFMLLRQTLYLEAVFKTLFTMAAMLFLIAWAWNPRSGFSGLGVFLSRYLLSIGLPFETWLQRLMECAASESDPNQFLALSFKHMLELPWVVGVKWGPERGESGRSGSVGEVSGEYQIFPNQPLVFTLYTSRKLSPSLIWHFRLLAQLTNEYYIAKQRARELQQVSYLRAVHETGARLTHDVKNLLQSLNNLCYMAQTPDDGDRERLNQLLQRQLPQITQRLQQTLEKLQSPKAPETETSDMLGAQNWWEALQQRYAHEGVVFGMVEFDQSFASSLCVPPALFDSVADNLLQNALLKRQGEGMLAVRVMLAADASSLRVCDNGGAVSSEVVDDLFRAPVSSENGLGIGLYHAARQAESYGYRLHLAHNEDGRVCFELRRREVSGVLQQ